MELKLACLTLVLATVVGISSGVPQHASTIRPPAFPLAVRNPYTNAWLPNNELPGSWPAFWTGRTKGWTGMVRVDGETYVYMGNPNDGTGNMIGTKAVQRATYITPTQTIFEIRAGPVDLTVNFFSPVEYEDIQRQSIPLSYVQLNIVSNDGAAHDVQAYMDITGEWATSDLAEVVTWSLSATPGGINVWSTEMQTQSMFGEFQDYPRWGHAILAGGTTTASTTTASGSDLDVRTAFRDTGALPHTYDDNFRCASCDWPTFGLAEDLGTVPATAGGVGARYIVGLYREENANFPDGAKQALWLSYWSNIAELVDFFHMDYQDAIARADTLDERILNDAFAAQGQQYADILALSLRQSFAGNEFSGTADEPIYYQKEISSGAFMQTVDVIYPAAPMFYYLNVDYLRMLIEPLFTYMEGGDWTRNFACHDIGAPYPNSFGQAYGGDMPIEESANMIMMVGNIVFHPDTATADAVAYAQSHYPIMSTWADYLFENTLYPTNQLTTDDFIGPTELNSGLALKGILGMATFARISALVGDIANEQRFNAAVNEFMPIWFGESIHNDGTHLKMEYQVDDGYQFKYNAFHDQLLDLNIVPQEVYEMEAAYYLSKLEPYGIPFCSTHDYTKSDWEMWTAAAFGGVSPPLREALVESLGWFLRFTEQRVPFTDWYVTETATHVGFISRPVVGGHFALLALDGHNALKKQQQQQ